MTCGARSVAALTRLVKMLQQRPEPLGDILQ